MWDYMMALHQRFCKEPDCRDVRKQLLEIEQEFHQALDRRGQEQLLKLADLGIELREETSLAAFTAGLQLGLGIAGELEPYSFEDEEEGHARQKMKKEAE